MKAQDLIDEIKDNYKEDEMHNLLTVKHLLDMLKVIARHETREDYMKTHLDGSDRFGQHAP